MALSDRERALRQVTEKQWQAQVMEMAGWLGWSVYHTHDSRRSEAGFPDLTLVRGERLLFAELKTEVGRVSGAQERWLSMLRAVPGVEVFVWRPSDAKAVALVLR